MVSANGSNWPKNKLYLLRPGYPQASKGPCVVFACRWGFLVQTPNVTASEDMHSGWQCRSLDYLGQRRLFIP